ncbi:metallophosphoesterase [Pseudoalteromonas shioyasakiensis]|uniref:metallophosphoesterase n=1 Tax=Pseudoalteromonas shioyasakiensis TaxID=1190813 RepID=UPI002118AF38|nr:metallophosphoesterase [Pseudoalteromonas shioyasakiensis]MCQ8876719.1 metallophosphoesterase [Pseudoalteromonas shioyasakiensis]
MPYSTRCLAKTPIHQQLHINDGTRVFIISDLDADYKKLAGALESVNFDYDNDTLIMLGDVIDRGNDSVKLIKHIIKHNFIMLLGNHEHMMLASLIDKDKDAFQLWVKNGGAWHFNETQEDLLLV